MRSDFRSPAWKKTTVTKQPLKIETVCAVAILATLLPGAFIVILDQPAAPPAPIASNVQPPEAPAQTILPPEPKKAIAKLAEPTLIVFSPKGPCGPKSKRSCSLPSLNVTIDPNTPLEDLLPVPPKAMAQTPSAFVDDLAEVPELMLTELLAAGRDNNHRKMIEAMAVQIAKMRQLNIKKPDAFLEALLMVRPDLAGLPFQMGSDCRLSQTRSRYLQAAVAIVHNARNRAEATAEVLQTLPRPVAAAADLPTPVEASRVSKRGLQPPVDSPTGLGAAFLACFLQRCSTDEISPRIYDEGGDKAREEHTSSARIAAMMQICGPTTDSSMKLAMVRYLASVSSVDSTRALVKTILFTPEEETRNVAIEALRTRRDKDYVDLLLQGFRYPWPDVSKRVGEALVKLDRKDLIPQIIDVLDEPDPRAPVTMNVDGKMVTTVREVVRINHHRNCVLCHASGHEVNSDPFVLTAQVPTPGQAMPSFSSGGYRNQRNSGLLVRIDVTYLRQDFSMMLPVADAAPWPEMQRFDFVARTRTLKDDEVKAYQEKFDQLAPGAVPPNHEGALAALRELTGKDTAPTAEAWRKLVKATK